MKKNTPLIVAGAFVALCMLAGFVLAANEVTVTAFLKVSKDNFELTRNVSNLRRDQAGSASAYNKQEISTNAHEALDVIADVTTNGWAFMRATWTNVDRYVDIGVQDSNSAFLAFLRLEGGDMGVFKVNPTATLYAQGGTSWTGAVPTVELEFWVNQD